MPNLARLIERGVMGNMSSLDPPICPLLWTSVITGHTADRHGILTARQTLCGVKTIPQILEERGIPSGIVNWHPHTSRQEVQAQDLTGDDLLPFVPGLSRIDQQTDRGLTHLAVALSRTINTHLEATQALEADPTGFFAFRYGLLEDLGTRFMRFHNAGPGEVYSEVISGACRFLDMTLGRIVELAGPSATIMLVSDHGYESGEHRPTSPASFFWRRSLGIFCMAGPGILADEIAYGATLLDVAPTLLTLFDLPVGEDMPGRTIAGAFASKPEVRTVSTWESPQSSTELAREQLIALGYLEPARGDDELFSLIRVHLSHGRAADAVPPAKELARRHPDDLLCALYLAEALFESGSIEHSRTIVDGLLEKHPGMPAASAIRANIFLTENNPHQALLCLSAAERRTQPVTILDYAIGRAHLALGRWSDAEHWFRTVLDTAPDLIPARLGLAQALLQLRRFEDAAQAATNVIVRQYNVDNAHRILRAALTALECS